MSPASYRGVYLWTGPDRTAKMDRLHRIEQETGIHALDRHRVPAGSLTGAQLLALCRQSPSVSEVRMIIVEDAQKLDAEAVEGLLHYAPIIATAACVFLLADSPLPVKHPLSVAASRLQTEDFPDKAAVEAKPFALLDALGQRNLTLALSAVRDQLASGREPVEVVGMLAWQLQRWIAVRRLLDQKMSLERVGEILGISAWQLKRIQAELGNRSLEELVALGESCFELDKELKSSRTIPLPAIERLLMRICGVRSKTAPVRG